MKTVSSFPEHSRGLAPTDTLHIALVVPLHGPAGIFGPSCEACAALAADEINAGHGVAGSEVRLSVVDSAAPPGDVANELDALISAGAVDAVTGWHLSSLREVLAARIADRVPYVYTALYEGGEHTPGVYLTGETPATQLLPALRWMAEELGIRRWCVVGDNYVWPRGSARAARRYAHRCGAAICDEIFVPLGTTNFAPVMREIERNRAQGVLMLLVGNDAVRFNRAFRAAGLDGELYRLTSLMEENMLAASGAATTRGLYTAAGFFETAATPENLDFIGRYADRHGPEAPLLNTMGESCYEGVRLVCALIGQARASRTTVASCAAGGLRYVGPRGEMELAGSHLRQNVYLARAAGLEFDVLAELTPVAP
jgi:ABC-type branched-subunit amino acid transport system substrate-binding protein